MKDRKKYKFIALCLWLFFIGQVSAQTLEEAVTLETETGNIAGTLLIADTTAQTPVVLIIAGSGPTDRNGNNILMVNNSLKFLAEGLASHGVSSLRYDKRGIAASALAGLKETDLRFEHYVADAKAWLMLLKNDTRFSAVVTAGHSEGSLIGMIASQNGLADKYISLAGIGSPAGDVIREQLKSQPPIVLDQATPIIESLEKGELVENVPQMLFALFRPSVQPYIISWFKYRPQEEIKKLTIPALIVQGTTDIQVGVAEAEKLYEASSMAEMYVLGGMNHILKEAPADRQENIATYSKPDLPLRMGLVEYLVQFIKE